MWTGDESHLHPLRLWPAQLAECVSRAGWPGAHCLMMGLRFRVNKHNRSKWSASPAPAKSCTPSLHHKPIVRRKLKRGRNSRQFDGEPVSTLEVLVLAHREYRVIQGRLSHPLVSRL